MKQFLRFQISGMTFFLWLLIFGFSGFYNTSDTNQILTNNKIMSDFTNDVNSTTYNIKSTVTSSTYLFSSEKIRGLYLTPGEFTISKKSIISDILTLIIPIVLIFSLPVGAFIHQLSTYFYFIIFKIKSVKKIIVAFVIILFILLIYHSSAFYFFILFILFIMIYMHIPEFIKYKLHINKITFHTNTDNTIDAELDRASIISEISSLKSYYYVRFDNGFLAPLLAFILIKHLEYLIPNQIENIALSISAIFLAYIPIILKEITELEDLLAKDQAVIDTDTNITKIYIQKEN